MIDISQLSLDNRQVVLHDNPFPFGWFDDFLSVEAYRNLEAGFVMPESHPEVSALGKGKKRVLFHVPPMPEKLGPICEGWSDFLELLGSNEFRAHCLHWIRRMLPLEGFAPGPYQELFRVRQMLGPEDVEFQCEFSNLGPGAYLPPHSDSVDKLASFVYYFRPASWQDAWGGATEVYLPKSPRHALNFSNFFLAPTEVEALARCEYRANRLFFFVKNDRAWHGVAPFSEAPASPRLSFNFSLRTKPGFEKRPDVAALLAAIRAAEQRAFV